MASCAEVLTFCSRNFHLPSSPFLSAEWQPAVQILLYSLIFLLSMLGNTLVITVLIRNKRMRTVTNIFLLSLAVSDLMLCLFCMPFNLIPNLLKDFIFGSAVCKTTAYFMGELLRAAVSGACPRPRAAPDLPKPLTASAEEPCGVKDRTAGGARLCAKTQVLDSGSLNPRNSPEGRPSHTFQRVPAARLRGLFLRVE